MTHLSRDADTLGQAVGATALVRHLMTNLRIYEKLWEIWTALKGGLNE